MKAILIGVCGLLLGSASSMGNGVMSSEFGVGNIPGALRHTPKASWSTGNRVMSSEFGVGNIPGALRHTPTASWSASRQPLIANLKNINRPGANRQTYLVSSGHGGERKLPANSLYFSLALPVEHLKYARPESLNRIPRNSVNEARSAQNTSIADTIRLADPTIFLDGDTYYLYGTSGDQGFLVYQSKDLVHWGKPVGKNNGYALSKGESYGTKGFWAPQVFKHKNRYYIIYTANEQLAIASSNSPLGPFKQSKLKHLSASGKQIDPFVYFDPNGKIYLFHVRLQNGNRIFVSEMKDDLSDVASESATECISALEPWENTQKVSWPVAEGPTILKHGNTYYMLYSANDFRNPDYAVGYATASNPLGPWKKSGYNPILKAASIGRNGTGHGDLFKDKKGHWQYVFHTHKSNQQPEPRVTAIVPVVFNGNQAGKPGFEIQKKAFRFLLSGTP